MFWSAQWCGSGSGIRYYFDPGIRDPRWKKNPEPGSGMPSYRRDTKNGEVLRTLIQFHWGVTPWDKIPPKMGKKGSFKTQMIWKVPYLYSTARNSFVSYWCPIMYRVPIMAQMCGNVYGKNKYNGLFLSFIDCTLKYLRRSTWISWKMMPMGFLRYQ